jgi:lysine 2,3-aminomutase
MYSLLNNTIVPPACWNDWRWQLRNRVEGSRALAALLTTYRQPADVQEIERVVSRYRFATVPYYLGLIDWSDAHDPIRRQCIPDARELDEDPVGCNDPYRELSGTGVPGLVHRFPDRVLLVVATDCAMTCRHCTRKNTLDGPRRLGVQAPEAALAYLAAHPRVREVLLSGGDPLLLETGVLDSLLSRLLAIPHVEVVRIGTRVPVVLPMRIDDELVDRLRRHRPLWLNTQFNHPRELTPEAVAACGRLVDAGIPVSNQTVLLRGVNDRLEVMRDLCCGLQRARVRPYYVFLCDPVSGISHFRVDRAVAAALQDGLRTSVGGLCLPRFVEDVPGSAGKVMIGCDHGQ